MSLRIRYIFPIGVLLLLISACQNDPQIIRLGKFVRVKTIVPSDTGNAVFFHEGLFRESISLNDDGKGRFTMGFGWDVQAAAREDLVCEIQSWEGVIADLKPCLENERCIGIECEYPVCIVPWNGDTLRIVGDGWKNYDQEWDSDSCNEIHLYLYEEAFYEF